MRIILIISTLLVLSFMSCKDSMPPPFSVLTPVEMKDLRKAHPDLILLDVRTPQEVAAGKIDGALELDFRDQEFRTKLQELDKEAIYGVYCKKGGRSAGAAEIMQELGFKQVYDLEGGYDAWIQMSQ